jgi:hypothetical protein
MHLSYLGGIVAIAVMALGKDGNKVYPGLAERSGKLLCTKGRADPRDVGAGMEIEMYTSHIGYLLIFFLYYTIGELMIAIS